MKYNPSCSKQGRRQEMGSSYCFIDRARSLRLLAVAAMAGALVLGAAAAPSSAYAATKVGKTSVTVTSGQGCVKAVAKKVKGAGHYQFKVYKGTKPTGKVVATRTQSRRTATINLKDGQQYCVVARGVSGNWFLKGKKSYGAWSKPKVAESKYIKYKIIYDTAGGDAPDPSWPTSFTRVTETFDLPVPTRAGYKLHRWSGEYTVNVNGHEYNREATFTKVEKGTTYSIKLRALWERDTSGSGNSGTNPGGSGSTSGGDSGADTTTYASSDVRATGRWLESQSTIEYKPDSVTTVSNGQRLTTIRGYYVKDGQRWLGPVTKITVAGGVPFIANNWGSNLTLSSASSNRGTLNLGRMPGTSIDPRDLTVQITGTSAAPVNLAATKGGDSSGLASAWWVGSETRCLAELTASSAGSDTCLSAIMNTANATGSFTVTALYRGIEIASCNVTVAEPSSTLAADLAELHNLEALCWSDSMGTNEKLATLAGQIASSYSYSQCDCIRGAYLLMLAARYDLGIEGCYYERCSAYMSSCAYDGVMSYFNGIPGASHVYLVVPTGGAELLVHAQGGDSLVQSRVAGSWGGTSGNWNPVSAG